MRHAPVASITASLLSGVPDLAGLSAVVHAIPYFDIEAAGSYFAVGWSAAIRAGPRFTIVDRRDASATGFTLRGSLLGGVRWLATMWYGTAFGPNAVAAVDLSWWVSRQVAITLRLTAGGFFTQDGRQWFPDARAGIGVTF